MQPVVFAPEVKQRIAFLGKAHMLDLADQDRVIATIAYGVAFAFEVRERIADDRHIVMPGFAFGLGKAIRTFRRKQVRQIRLLVGQHVDSKMPGFKQHLRSGRCQSRANQQQRRIKADRCKAVGSESHGFALGRASGDHCHAGRETAQGAA